VSSGPDERTRPWFERDPERLEWELTCFREAGFTPEQSVLASGLLAITSEVTFKGEPVEVRTEFAADHPFVPPHVFGPPDFLERHQDPEGGTVCVVDNEQNWWHPNYPAAWLVERLQQLLDATAAGEDVVAAGEADMPEPLSAHIPKRENAAVLVPDACLKTDLGASRGRIRLVEVTPHLHTVAELDDGDGRRLGELAHNVRDRLGGERELEGLWVELDEAPKASERHDVERTALELVRAETVVPTQAKKKQGRHARRRERARKIYFVGVTFFEEGPTRQELRRSWLFFEIVRYSDGAVESTGKPIRAQALSKSVRDGRIAELRGLDECRFVVFGAGSLGGPLAVELAKAGAGRIDVIDGDFYDLNNAVRHVLAVQDAGLDKAPAVAAQAERISPFTHAVAHDWSVGIGTLESELTRRLVEVADVVVDATGSHSITRLLHRRATEAGTPLVTTALTPGGFGGRVLVLRGTSPCFDCFLLAQEHGIVAQPQEGPVSNVTPFGCSHPAASCAGFDALELGCVATRIAVQASGKTAYPPLDFDWAVVNFRSADTRWQQGGLAKHPACEWCR